MTTTAGRGPGRRRIGRHAPMRTLWTPRGIRGGSAHARAANPTGAFVISDVARQDIFRPAPEHGPRRRFTTSPPARHEITGPRSDRIAAGDSRGRPGRGRPETARAAAEVGGTR